MSATYYLLLATYYLLLTTYYLLLTGGVLHYVCHLHDHNLRGVWCSRTDGTRLPAQRDAAWVYSQAYT